MRLYINLVFVVVLVFCGWIAYREVDGYLNPTPDVIRYAEIQNELKWLELKATVLQVFLPTAAMIALVAMAGGARWVWRWSGAPEMVRAVDGLFPVLVWDRSTIWDRLTGRRRVTTHDPGRAMASTMAITTETDGTIHASTDTPDERQADQIAVTQAAIGVQKALAEASSQRAPKGPTVAEIKAQKGWYDNPPQPRGSAQVVTPAALPAPSQPVLTLADAMKPAVAGDIIIGQEPDGARGLAVFKPADDYHISLLGSSGYGKSTNAAWAILMGFLRMGGQAVVAEPEGAAQFAEIQPWAEWARLDGAGLTRHAEAIHREFQRRGDEMTRRGAGHFSDIPASERPPHLLAIFEEYTKARSQAAKAGTLGDFDAIMGEIAQDAGKTGIHLLLIAQHFHPTGGQPWPAIVKDNCGFRISYNQPGNDTTLTLAGLHKLSALEKGQFAHRGKVYNGYHARPEFARILANVPRRSGPGVLDGAGATTAPAPPAQPGPTDTIRRIVPAAVRAPVRQFVETPTPPSTGGERPTNSPTNTNTNSPTNSQGGEWEEFARRFFEQNPHATQTALAQAMADVDPDGRHYRRFVGGLTNGLYHTYSPNGDNYTGAPQREPEPVFAAAVEAYQPPAEERRPGERPFRTTRHWRGAREVLTAQEWYEEARRLPAAEEDEE